MKRNFKGFLALGLSAAMVMSPAAVRAADPEELIQELQAENLQPQSQNTGEQKPADEETAEKAETGGSEQDNAEQEDVDETKDKGENASDAQKEADGQESEELVDVGENGEKSEDVSIQGTDQGPEKDQNEIVTRTDEKEISEAKANSGAPSLLSVDIGGTVYEDGNYDMTVESSYKMFKIVKTTAEVKGDKLLVTIRTSSASYPYLYIGSKEDETKEPVISGTANSEGGYDFTFEVPASAMGTQIKFVPGKADGSWYTNKDVMLTLPSALEIQPEITPEPTPEPTPKPDPEPEPGPEVCEDGNYQTEVDSSSGMFRVVNCVLTSKDGRMSAVITLSGTGYDKLYMGTAEEAASAPDPELIPYETDSEGRYMFTVPVEALDTGIAVAAHSVRQDVWYDRTLTFKSEGMEKIEEENDGLNDGQYLVNVDSSSGMFRVVNCVLTSKDGRMSAVITLSGTGYDKLYMGTAEEAASAPDSELISYETDSEGRYMFTVPVEALDTGIAVAAHSVRQDSWYDRTLTFRSEGMEKIGGEGSDPGSGTETPGEGSQTPGGGTENPGSGTSDPGSGTGSTPGGSGGTGTSSGNDGVPDHESSYTSDLSGSTGAVNSSTTLADGVYTPDNFSWSGGSGRVGLSCNKVTISGGQAYATIVFSSSSYQYVKANGNVYYGTQSGGTSVFVIPVALNQNNRIIGMTTRMSAAHEIAYTIYVYLAAASGNGNAADSGTSVIGAGQTAGQSLDETAPEIIGLEFESETELEYAEYFKIYHYSQGVTLLEIDLTGDTAREDLETDLEEAPAADAEEAAEAMTEELDSAPENAASEEIADPSEVYKGKVVKYLIVPENVEIPAGLDKEVAVVQLPADKAYAASDDILKKMEELGLLDNVAAVGCEQGNCPVDEIADAMEKEEVVYAGNWEDPDYRTLVKSECNLVMLPAEVLPQKEEAPETEELTPEEQEERLTEIIERCATLGIPLVVDRSDDEKTDLARYEWIKVYGVLFGCEEEMDALFRTAAETAGQAAESVE